MKKTIHGLLLPLLLLMNTPSALAEDDQKTDDLDTLVRYMKNLGAYLGYDLETPVDPSIAVINTLLDYKKNPFQIVFQQSTFYAVFNAIPVNSFSKELSYFTQTNANSDYATLLNNQANYTFLNPTAYNSPTTDSVSVVKNVDQKDYQKDPVTQAVLNIIGTPDISSCGTLSSSECLSQNKVMETVLNDVSEDGFLPGRGGFFTFNTSSKFISQLNSNILIAPLLYSTTASQEPGAGLPNASQEQQAANFVRYATGSLAPSQIITDKEYGALWDAAYPDPSSRNSDKNQTTDALAAQTNLNKYLTGMRVYAAQNSVAISNLYAILSKRMPQTNANSPPTSQALSEYQMASWRLYNPQNKGAQWVDQINSASSATVQKEIAVLLSEINYQMYLSRQQDERILLTNSLQLLVSLAQTKPSATDVSTSPEN